MSSLRHLDHLQQQEADPLFDYKNKLAARDAAAAKKTPEYTASRADDDIIAANASRRKEIHKQIDSIACPDCKKMARILEDPTYKCTNCTPKPQGGSKRKSKSQRRKKSKSQRRRKSIKRRH